MTMEWKTTQWQNWLVQNHITLPSDVYPVINVEGPDCGGKTSVLNILLDVIKHSFFLHTSAPTKGSSPEYYEKILYKGLELIDLLRQPILIDRYHIGEAVYGSLFRGHKADFSVLESELAKRRMKNVYVTASSRVLIERMEKRGDWYIKTHDLERITSRYEEELQKSILPTYVLDTTNNITQEDVRKLLQFIYS